jgi:hypothetical protein
MSGDVAQLGLAVDTRAKLETALLAAMDTAASNVMQWGVDDCTLWYANLYRDALGEDLAADFRGRYKTRRGAFKLLGRKGLKGLALRIARRKGWQRINPEFAQVGDVGLAYVAQESTAVLALVTCRAHGWFVGRNERGYTALLARDVAAAWSVLDNHTSGARVNLRRISLAPAMTPTSAAAHDPISDIIGISAIINAGLGLGAIAGGIGAAIGGFVISTAVTIGITKS